MAKDTQPIGIGFIGANPRQGWGGSVHMPALAYVPGVELAAVCNTTQANADEAARAFGARRAYADPAALAADPDVDLVVVCVRAPKHYPLVKTALEAGKAVYCEWPLGRTTAEAEELAALAKQKGVANIVGLQARATPMINRMRDLIAEGYVGRVLSCSLLGTAPTWGAVVDPYYRGTADAREGITLLRVSGAHALDTLLYCAGEFAELNAFVAVQRDRVTVKGSGEVIEQTAPDQVLVQGRLVSGAMASYHMRGGMTRGGGQVFEVNGTEGDLILSTPDNAALQNADTRLRGSQIGAPLEEITVPDSYFAARRGAPVGRIANVAEMYSRVAQALREGKPLTPSFEFAVQRHHTLEAISRAAATGQKQVLASRT
jgi:predicted dehydrogenase